MPEIAVTVLKFSIKTRILNGCDSLCRQQSGYVRRVGNCYHSWALHLFQLDARIFRMASGLTKELAGGFISLVS